MGLTEEHKEDFNTMMVAALMGDLALMECKETATGDTVAVVCMVNKVDGELEFVPVAKMFNGNPYEELIPPH